MARGDWTKTSVKQAFKASRRVFTAPAFDVRVAPKTHARARLLIITSRKTGKAVERNRFRRRVRDVFARLGLSSQNYDWIVIGKKWVGKTSYTDIFSTFQQIAERLP